MANLPHALEQAGASLERIMHAAGLRVGGPRGSTAAMSSIGEGSSGGGEGGGGGGKGSRVGGGGGDGGSGGPGGEGEGDATR